MSVCFFFFFFGLFFPCVWWVGGVYSSWKEAVCWMPRLLTMSCVVTSPRYIDGKEDYVRVQEEVEESV